MTLLNRCGSSYSKRLNYLFLLLMVSVALILLSASRFYISGGAFSLGHNNRRLIGSDLVLAYDISTEKLIRCFTSEKENLTRMSQDCDLVHVDFEVYGTVQGVFFRKYTQQEANKLGLRGFCRNTRAGTVSGSMEGPRQSIDQMKHWLHYTGSPMSRISDAVFKNEKTVDAFTFPTRFDIAKTS